MGKFVMPIRIRRASSEDVEEVLPLVVDFATSFDIDERIFRESFFRLLESRSALVLVAEEEERLIGYCLGFSHDTFYANGRVAWLEEIMVLASHRRRGVGEALMKTFEDWARKQGAVLSALATRRAASFYKAIDYEESASYFRKLL
jgi:GNAT superfamily N-acetyltransferase